MLILIARAHNLPTEPGPSQPIQNPGFYRRGPVKPPNPSTYIRPAERRHWRSLRDDVTDFIRTKEFSQAQHHARHAAL